MPAKDHRVAATTYKGKMRTSGRMAVTYRNGRGGTRTARVLSEGTVSGLKLDVDGVVVDNVAKATTMKSTNAYFAR